MRARPRPVALRTHRDAYSAWGAGRRRVAPHHQDGSGPAMNVTLTGPAGFIGSHVLTELQKHGDEVTALVRDDTQADSVAAIGATPTVVDLYDSPTLATLPSSADPALHPPH